MIRKIPGAVVAVSRAASAISVSSWREVVNDQKAVLIIGASSGIGLAAAEKLASEGYIVYAGARS